MIAQTTVNPFNPPVAVEPVLQNQVESRFAMAWYVWFSTKVAKILQAPVSASFPATAKAAGVPGQMASDGTYLYICTGVNQWKRALLSPW